MGARMVGIGSALAVTAAMLSAGIDTVAIAHAEPATQSQNDAAEPGTGRSARVESDGDTTGVTQEAYDAYYALKEQKKFRFLVFKIVGARLDQVALETASSSTDYDDFIEAIQAGGDGACRYGVYDFQYERDGKQHRKIFLIGWAPEDAKTKQLSPYAKGVDSVQKSLAGTTFYAAREQSELSYNALLEKARETP
ncbi:hypothetical protein OG203_44475 [Nocardia sp. NBC_01499]|uniref:hypothetical protein n=1 Tax=Nocardia sp. NBC_01499 TaxID=2903597 RepID=UPI00386E8BF4